MITLRAKEYLQEIPKLNKLIKNKRIEKEQLLSIAYGITSHSEGERVQSSGNPQKMANAVETLVDYDREIDALAKRKKEIISDIEQLNSVEYDILHKIYVQGKNLYDVADLYDKSYSWVTTVHGRALKKVQDKLDSREKEEDGQQIRCLQT